MEGLKPHVGLFLLILIFTLIVTPLQSGAADTDSPKKRGKERETKLTLSQAVATAITRNLRLADSRLAIAEKERQRREAYSDFFPTINIAYTGAEFRYRNAATVSELSEIHPGRRSGQDLGTTQITTPSGGVVKIHHSGAYPFRIDPYRNFSINATITQPLFSGGKLVNDYKYAKLGVDYSEIQMEVDRQDLILDVYEACYQLMQAEKLLDVANSAIRALKALRSQTMEFFKAGDVARVDVLSTEGQLAQAYLQQTQAGRDIDANKAILNYLLRFPQETPVDIIQDLNYRPNPYRIPDIYSIAANNRLEIRQANISVEQALALVKSSKGDLLPEVSVPGQASRINDDWNVFDPEANNDWRIMGVLTWTFDIFRKRETVKERTASQARTFVAREQVVEQIMDEVKTAYLDMKKSETDIQKQQESGGVQRRELQN